MGETCVKRISERKTTVGKQEMEKPLDIWNAPYVPFLDRFKP